MSFALVYFYHISSLPSKSLNICNKAIFGLSRSVSMSIIAISEPDTSLGFVGMSLIIWLEKMT